MASERALIANLRKYAAYLVRSVKASEFWRQKALEDVKTAYESSVVKLHRQLHAIQQMDDFSIPGWQDPRWSSEYQPMDGVNVPRLTRVGLLTESGKYGQLQTPALVPIIGSRNVLIKSSGAAKAEALDCMQSIMLRLLATIPPGKLRFTMVDPVGLGQNMAGFMHLSQFSEELVGGKVWTEPDHIEKQLVKLTMHMETVIQKYLLNRYDSMEEYNLDAGEVAEPYRLLAIANFPVNFNDSAAQRLISIASNGPRTGVYVLAVMDTEASLPYDFNVTSLERTATIISHNGGRFVWDDPDFSGCKLELDTLPPTEQFDRIVLEVGEVSKVASKVEVPFDKVIPDPREWWQANAGEDLGTPIGRIGARQIQRFELGHGTAQHALLVGKTGSGKSTLLHVIVTSLALTYSPEEVQLYLVDFKKGVEFRNYAEYKLPHARVVAIQSEREFGLSVLKGLDAELQRRGDLFRGEGYTSLGDYRDKTQQQMPRILLLVDEFQEFFSEDDALAAQATQILDRLVRQGRAFGIHVLLASQSLAGGYTVPRSTTDQMAVRIALQCSDADSRLILSDENPAARLLNRPGEAIYNAANGLVEGNNLFQVVWLSDEQRVEYLQKIQDLGQKNGFVRRHPMIVFEGNTPARVEENQELGQLISAPTWPESSRAVSAWLGEAVEIKPHTAAVFRRQGRSNLLIVGQDEETTISMLSAAMLSLAAQHDSRMAQFCLLNLCSVDAPWRYLLETLERDLPHPIVSIDRRNLIQVLGALAREVRNRFSASDASRLPAIYLFLAGLQRARDLRSVDDFTPSEGTTYLSEILRDGPDVGIHVLAWSDTYAGLERVLQRRDILEFEQRVALQMSANDSTHLLDTPVANKLGAHRAYLQHDEYAGRLEKFRPYGPADPKWITWAARQLKRRVEP